MQALSTSPLLSISYRIFSKEVGTTSEGEVNVGISHETLTGEPIMEAAAADKDGGKTHGKGLSINEMGHHMNVECALSTVRKKEMPLIWPRPLFYTIEETADPNLEIKRLSEKPDQEKAHWTQWDCGDVNVTPW